MASADPRPLIAAAATAFVHSYSRAMALSSKSSVTIPLIAAALGAHYGPNTTSYTAGHQTVFASSAEAVHAIAPYLERLERSGLGCDMSMVAHRVEPVSASSALCWVTWAIRPREGCGLEGWQWENVYAYRRTLEPSTGAGTTGATKWIGGQGEGGGWEKPEGWWEFLINDNETLGILGRLPNFFEI